MHFAGRILLACLFAGLAVGWNNTCACNITVAVCTNVETVYGFTGNGSTAKCYNPSGVCFCPVEEGNLTITIPPGTSFGMFLPNAGYADAGCWKFFGGLPDTITPLFGMGIVSGPVFGMVGNQPLNWNGIEYGGNQWTTDDTFLGPVAAMCTIKPCPISDPYSRPGSGHFLQLTNTLAVPQTIDMNIHIGVAASPDSSCPCAYDVRSPGMCMGPWEPHPGYPPMAHCHNINNGPSPVPADCHCDDGWGSGKMRCGGSCTDGIQNYDETGVDCGGIQCCVCPDTSTATISATTTTSTSASTGTTTAATSTGTVSSLDTTSTVSVSAVITTTTTTTTTATTSLASTTSSTSRSVSSESSMLTAGIVTCLWLVYGLGMLVDCGVGAMADVLTTP